MKIYVMQLSYILIILCLLVGFASAKMDYTPKVLGNANMDGAIDRNDVDFLKAIIAGTEKPTNLADANGDGKINEKDVDQVEKILNRTESEIIVIDALNRTVKIKMPVERVVVAFAPLAEEIAAIGADNKIVGVSSDIIKLPELFPTLSKCQNVGRTKELDLEKIISLKPDLLVIYEGGDKNIINKLETASIPVVFSESHGDLLNSISAIRRLGYILDVTDKAEEYTNWYGSYLDDISSKTDDLSDEEKPSIFYYWAPSDLLPLGTSGKGCPVIAMINTAGGRDLAADRPGGDLPGVYIHVDSEWVIEQNPSIVLWEALIPNNNAGYQVNNSTAVEMMLNKFANITGFSNIDAVKNQNVYSMSFYILTETPWIGTVYLAKLLHPDLFQDMDPREVHQEYLKRFLHLDYDIYKQGVFMYPIPGNW